MDFDHNKEIGARLLQSRKREGYTRDIVGQRLGVNPTTVQAHESGRNGVKPDMALKYCKLYKVELEWLFTGQANPAAEILAALPDEAQRTLWLQMGQTLVNNN